MNKLSLDEPGSAGKGQPNILLQDMASFPALHGGSENFNNFGGAGASLNRDDGGEIRSIISRYHERMAVQCTMLPMQRSFNNSP